MIRILTIVGARPQFVKAAMVSRAIIAQNAEDNGEQIDETIIHTGQHYDAALSDVFFTELGIPAPERNLKVGSGSHSATTAAMLVGIENAIQELSPDWVLLYGDTNSTLAGALAAAKLGIPIAHVEAGLRSFNRSMPEEINRVVTDHLSTLLFCPTCQAVDWLVDEGITRGVHHTGDVMFDAARFFGPVAERRSRILSAIGLAPKGYCLATVHRAENTDNRDKLGEILKALGQVNRVLPVVLPLHPRTRKRIEEFELNGVVSDLKVIDPVSFLDMIALEKNAKTILTDSGGVQKEAYFHRVPCVTLRGETEWPETVAAGWNRLAGHSSGAILAACSAPPEHEAECNKFGDGDAARKIVALLENTPCSI